MVTLDTGVGGGIILDGRIISGSHGAGGEIGHAAVQHDETEKCNCGNRGCLEQYASATGIVRVAKRAMEASDEESVLRGFSRLLRKMFWMHTKKGISWLQKLWMRLERSWEVPLLCLPALLTRRQL